MVQAPELETFQLQGRLSFSQLRCAERCLFSGIPARNLRTTCPWPIERLGRAQLIGMVYHSVIEDIAKSSDDITADRFSIILDRQIEKYAARSVFSKFEIRQWPEIGGLYRTLSERVIRRAPSEGKQRGLAVLIEKEFNSTDGQLTGRIDHLVLRADQPWMLTEFKSAKCVQGGALRQDYIRQLHFYAGLLRDNFGRFPSTLRLISPQDGSFEFPCSNSLLEEVGYHARVIFDLMRFRLGGRGDWKASLKPGSASCQSCSKRLVCPAFRSLQGTVVFDGPAHLVWGRIRRVVSGDGLGRIELDIEAGSLPSGLSSVLDFEPRHYSDFPIQDGTSVVITDLYASTGAIRMTPTSQILEWVRRDG